MLHDIPTIAPVDDFSLDDLLAESLAIKEAETDLKAARKALSLGGMPVEDRAKLQESVRGWELQNEWTAVAATIIFDTQCCTHCGDTHSHYLGLYQKQASKKGRVDRWIQSTEVANIGLKREIKHNSSYIPMCSTCAHEFGWKE